MAAKSLAAALIGVRSAFVTCPARAVILKSTLPFQRPFHSTHLRRATAVPSNSHNPVSQNMSQSDDNRHSAFLGEADSNDGFEAYKDAHGEPHPPIDGTNAAYLGEADSDDGFEAHKEIHGQSLEAVDASQSAYLGEADSDDGFESDVEINPEKYRHRIEDASISGLHGQSGEGDGPLSHA